MTEELQANAHVQTVTVDDEPTTGVEGANDITAELCALAPIGLLAELTHRCPLQCGYCSNPIELAAIVAGWRWATSIAMIAMFC